MTRKSNTTAKHKPTTTSRLSDPTAHKLTIHSLNDAQASCSCGGWSFARTGRATRAQIRSEWFMHKKFRTEFACIIPGCTGTKLEGRKYCAAHQERANGQILAEKVREQREADAERANRQWLDGADEDIRYPICPECQANLETPVDLLTCPD